MRSKTSQNQGEKDHKSWNIQWFQHNCNQFVVGLELMSVLKWILTLTITYILPYIYDYGYVNPDNCPSEIWNSLLLKPLHNFWLPTRKQFRFSIELVPIKCLVSSMRILFPRLQSGVRAYKRRLRACALVLLPAMTLNPLLAYRSFEYLHEVSDRSTVAIFHHDHDWTILEETIVISEKRSRGMGLHADKTG